MLRASVCRPRRFVANHGTNCAWCTVAPRTMSLKPVSEDINHWESESSRANALGLQMEVSTNPSCRHIAQWRGPASCVFCHWCPNGMARRRALQWSAASALEFLLPSTSKKMTASPRWRRTRRKVTPFSKRPSETMRSRCKDTRTAWKSERCWAPAWPGRSFSSRERRAPARLSRKVSRESGVLVESAAASSG